MDDSSSNLLEKIQQYQNSIIKHSEKGNDERILYYIKKLYDMPVTVEHLKQTGIGRTMNSLRKYSGSVGVASKAIVANWKTMVANEEEETVKPDSSPIADDTPPDSPEPSPSIEKQKVKSERSDRKEHSRRDESKHRKHDSSDRSKSRSEDRHSKSHHRKEDKRDSHKSSHKEKEHKSHRKHEEKSRKEEKSRHDHKRKHEEERSSSKKIKIEPESSDSEDSERLLVDNVSISSLNSEDNILPDSTTNHDSRENTQSPVEKEKKHKHDKHRSPDKKELNGSSKKSSHKEKETKKSSKPSSKDTKPSSSTKSPDKNKKVLLHDDNGIDSGSGASFAEALGMMGPVKKNNFKKKSSTSSASPTPSTSTVKSSKSTSTSNSTAKPRTQSPLTQSPNLNLLSPQIKLEPLDTTIDATIVSQLPEITTNYKPLGLNYDSPYANVKNMSEEEALSVVISSKTQRTKVYSGNKTNWGYVPSLFQLCVRILQDNIDALEYTGGVPYEILKPVLERASANQLLNSEYYNPYLVEEDDELWELHCKRECKGMKRQEMETWREMYLRCRDERDAKLKALTVNIKQSIDKSLPVRQTKLAYVDSVVKPPRGIARKQAKYGTSENLKKPLVTPTQRLNSIASGSGGEKISVPTPRAVSTSSASAMKPKKAPLMQKTLALMKGRFGRR